MDSVIEAHCTCEAGNSESCNHVVALAFFLNCMILRGYDEIPENPSCTSLPMEWNKPRGKKLLPGPLAGSVFHKPTNKDRKKDPVKCIIRNPIRNTTLSKIPASSVHALKTKLNATDPSIGFAALLSPEDMSDPRTVHPYASHLGATPDGIVYDKDMGQYGILEIKCPYTTKVANLAEYAKLKTCMKVDENNVLKLKITHDYYFQVQGLSGLRWADFVIYLSNSKEITTERIIFDPLFCQDMYEKLTKIYEDNLSELVVVNVEGTDGEV